MAQFNEILVGRFNRFFQKYLQMKGPSPAPQLATEIAAAFSLDLDSDTYYLRGWEMFGNTAQVTAVAAQTSALRLRNPTASGIIAVIDSIWFWTSVADNVGTFFGVGAATTDLAGIASPTAIDPRGRPSPACILSGTTNQAGLGTQIHTRPMAANVATPEIITKVTEQIPLLPGRAWQLTTNVVNTNLVLAIRWRERMLEESEAA